MIRLFRVYYPLRALVLLAVEVMIVYGSFVLATILQNREAWWILLNVDNGYLKILGVTVMVLLLSHLLDLYNTSLLRSRLDQVFRLLLALGIISIGLDLVGRLFHGFLPGNSAFQVGIMVLLVTLYLWRSAYAKVMQLSIFRERVYVLGTGERARRVVAGLRETVGIEVVGWTGDLENGEARVSQEISLPVSSRDHRIALVPELEGAQLVASVPEGNVGLMVSETGAAQLITSFQTRSSDALTYELNTSAPRVERTGLSLTRESVATHLVNVVKARNAHRIIVAMEDRRGWLPVNELLELRLLQRVKAEEATSWLEKITGRIEVEGLNPSWLVFAEGFRFSDFNRLLRRGLNFGVALIGLILALPLFPFVMLAVRLSSAGPIFYSQERVGRGGQVFRCHKFRTMRKDAEADTGATWAADNDPRITKVGKFLRASRLDEIPQLWCVLVGDMHFVGPRPERPEFVKQLSEKIPYYGVRHTVRTGITGWAQVQYKYGNTLEDAREKLQYDLFYIKNASIGLDFWIVFQTVKIVILGRGH